MSGVGLNQFGIEVLKNTKAILGYWDKDLICRFANNAYIEWLGLKPEEIIDRITIPNLPGDLYKKNLPYITKVLAGKTQVFEREFLFPSGELRNSITTYTPHLVDGAVVGFHVHVADITAVKNRSSKGIVLGENYVNKVIKTLQLNLLTVFPGLKALAKENNISESKLKRDFKEQTGLNTFSYYRKLQMEFAYSYLSENKCSRKQMAEMLNFSNPSNFSAAYNSYLKEYHDSLKLKERENLRILQIFNKVAELGKIGVWESNFVNNTYYWSEVTKRIFEVDLDFKPNSESLNQFCCEGENRKGTIDFLTKSVGDRRPFDIDVEIISAKSNSKKVRIIGYPSFETTSCIGMEGIIQELK